MKVKLMRLYNAGPTLEKLSSGSGPSAKANYWIAKLVKTLSTELQSIEEQRKALIHKFGTKTDTGVTVEKEKMEEYVKEFNSLLDSEVDLAITSLEVEYLDGIKLTSADFLALDFAINEPKQYE